MASSDDHSQGSLHRHSDRSHRHDHGHSHGYIDVSITTSSRGLWAVKWSFVGMFATAVFQVVIVAITGSVALLADTIHNFGDAATAIPLAIAFLFARKKPTKQFSFGYGRVEDLAGAMVVVTILFSACVAAYEAIHKAAASAASRASRGCCRGFDYWIFGKRVGSPFSHCSRFSPPELPDRSLTTGFARLPFR